MSYRRSPRIIQAALWSCALGVASWPLAGFGQEAPPPPAPAVAAADALPAGELLKKSRAVFDAGDFAAAEQLFEQFERDFGDAPEAKAAVEANKPLLALCKVQLKKFSEAGELIDASAKLPKVNPRLIEELRFWRGICYMQAGEYPSAQHAFGTYYANGANPNLKRHEALILFGTCYTLLEQHDIAAEFFAAQAPKVREEPAGQEVAGRAVVLQMNSLLESNDLEGALALVREEFPRLNEITQIISFQSLALQLGSRFLEQERFHRAIVCLQRIWHRERLLTHQRDRLGELQERLELLQARPDRAAAVFALEGMITRVERELENFEKMENFDSALRLRLAMCFQGLGRYRESALIIEDMLVNMEPDEIVESATLALIQSWMEIERWPKAIEGADKYMERFGRTPLGHREPMVRFLKAQCLQNDYRVGEAAEEYGSIAASYPDSSISPRAEFMKGFCGLLQDDYEAALPVFEGFAEKYQDEERLIEDCFYWQGMCYSFQKEYEKARDHMRAYLKRFKDGRYSMEAIFRIAFCTQALAEYPDAIAQFEAFLEQYASDPLADEARLLLGDALFAEGEIDAGIASYQAIRPEATRFFEDGWFKIGKALRLTEDVPGMRAHFEEFVEQYHASNRLPEAIYWIGWTHRAEGNEDKTREIYWDSLRRYGNDPERYAIEDIFLALPKIYPGEARDQLLRDLDELRFEAERAKQDTLALRALWAKGRLQELRNAGRGPLLEASRLVDVKIHNPLIIADCADALFESGNDTTAEKLYVGLRKWHPRAIQKDRVFLGLGRLAEKEGDRAKALEYYDRFERETIASPRLGEVLLTKARLYAADERLGAAYRTLDQILEDELMATEHKANALFEYGELLALDRDKEKATAYFERVYVAYGKYRDLVAKAYWRRGQLLEELEKNADALAVYRELAARDDLRRFDEVKLAKERIPRLEPLVDESPEPEPEGAEQSS